MIRGKGNVKNGTIRLLLLSYRPLLAKLLRYTENESEKKGIKARV